MIKPFFRVREGDVGQDYGDEKGTVVATGTYSQLKQYDSTGACDFLQEGEGNEMVAVLDEEGEYILYVYGPEGFFVEPDSADILRARHGELKEARDKMATACQNGSKKAWRRYGKKVIRLSRELNVPVQEWMEEAFGKSVEEKS